MTSSDMPLDSQYAPPASLHWSRRDWAALILLALLVALFFWRILTPNLADRASFPPGDFSRQFWAFATFEVRELSAGRMPLWNPYTYAGAPFWADIQSAVLYPISLLTLLLSGPWGFSLFALEVEAVAHFWLASIFTYLLVRRLTRHRGAALFAAITFTFGGYLTGYPSQQLAVLETVVWLPLLLYFTDRALMDRSSQTPHLRPSLSNTLAAGLVWGVILLAGHPQSALFVFYTFILYVMFLALVQKRQQGDPSTSHPAHQIPTPPQRGPMGYSLLPTPHSLLLTPPLVILIGLGFSAIAWLPGLEYMRLSVRAAGLYDKMAGGFPINDLIQMLLPGSVSFYSPLYVGILPLLLAVWVALSLRRRETTFWGVLAAGALLLSLGGETFLYTPFYLLVPGFSIFRDQERAAFIVSFALAMLAGYGFKYQISSQQTSNSKLQTVVGWLLIGAVGLVILFFYGLNNAGWQNDSPFYLLLSRSVWLAILLALIWGVTKIGERRSEIRSLGSGTSGKGSKYGDRGQRTTPYSLLLSPPKRGPIGYFLLTISYLLLVTFDLFSVNWKTNLYPSLPEAQTAVPATVQAIQQDASSNDTFRVYNEYRIYENYGVPYALEDAWGASPLRLARYDAIYHSLRMERLWELLNVKYVITWRKELYAPSEIIYQEPANDDVTYVHRLSHVAPRAWLVYQVEEAGDDAALSRLDAFDFDPSQVALVPPDASILVGGHPPEDEIGQIQVVHRTPGSTSLNISAPADSLLMLSEIYYPGWRAAVDGQIVPIVRADYILRGVPLPVGEHHVEVFYQPVTLIGGALISGVTCAAVAAAGLWIWLNRKTLKRQSKDISPVSPPLREEWTK
jgi:hypothetical protein